MGSVRNTNQILPDRGSSSTLLQHTIILDFDVLQGGGCRLVATTSPNMIREYLDFPYAIGIAGEITVGFINTTHLLRYPNQWRLRGQSKGYPCNHHVG